MSPDSLIQKNATPQQESFPETAEAAIRRALALTPDSPALHAALGTALMRRGDFTNAIASYETALRLDYTTPECLCDLGTAYAKSGRLQDAIDLYRRVLATDPGHRAARINLAQLLRQTADYPAAIALLTQLAAEYPDNALVHGQLGVAYAADNQLDLSFDHFQRVLALQPDDAAALQYIANIQQIRGHQQEADKHYRRSLELRPLITIDATRSPPDFRCLLLFAPGAGNTPLDCIAEAAPYENNILNLLPDAAYDVDGLRQRADVVVNLIADVDQSRSVLAQAAALLDRLGKPTINHPRKILQTDRETIARLLEGAPDCVVPRTRRLKGADLLAPDFDAMQIMSGWPLLVRPAGTHGGIDFEKADTPAELAAFVARRPEDSYYLTDYVDYRSSDGFFRKYRFIFVGDDVLPYHLAIDNKWKIHHVTTDMANQKWMQDEEKFFLEHPHSVFNARQYDALHAIRRRIGLDYFGIDCALDRDGRVVVFEVNACMLVHQHNENFAYKTAPVQRIKDAFDAMLLRMTKTNHQETPC